jgi:hypothetical protein
VIKKLSEEIQPQKLLLFSFPDDSRKFSCPDDSRKFIGSIKGNSFEIYRTIRCRNSFLPRIKGQFTQIGNNTLIKIKMSLHPVVAVFMTFWLGLCGSFLVMFVIGWITTPDSFYVHPLEAILPTLVLFILGYSLMIIPFNIEVGKAKFELDKLFSELGCA